MSEEMQPTKEGAAPVVKRPRGRPKKLPQPAAAGPSTEVRAKRVRKVVPKAEVISTTTVTPLNYIFTVGRRKRAVARVFLYREGQGTIEVNGKTIEHYFPGSLLTDIASQSLVQSPFKASVRVVAQVRGGGIQGQAEAVRLGIARALLKIDETIRPTFRARGYLTRDPREKERKKPGLKRARRAPQWQKR